MTFVVYNLQHATSMVFKNDYQAHLKTDSLPDSNFCMLRSS